MTVRNGRVGAHGGRPQLRPDGRSAAVSEPTAAAPGECHVDVCEAPVSPADAIAYCQAPGHGAFDLFVGRVRDHNEGRVVRAVTYDVHAGLCRRAFLSICTEACSALGPESILWLVHRRGRVAVGEASVVAAVSSPHRAAAFRACQFLVERMKRRAPIWKQEHYEDGDSEWLAGHPLRSHG